MIFMYLQKRTHRKRDEFFYQQWKSLENSISQKIWTWALLVKLFYCCCCCCGWCADSVWFYNWFCYCCRLNGAAMSEFTFQATTSRWAYNYTHSLAVYTHTRTEAKSEWRRRGEKTRWKKYGDESQKICHMSVFWL